MPIFYSVNNSQTETTINTPEGPTVAKVWQISINFPNKFSVKWNNNQFISSPPKRQREPLSNNKNLFSASFLFSCIILHIFIKFLLLLFRLVEGRTRGWISFDITPALKDWISKPSNNQGLELWIVSATTGRQAAMVASRMKFVKPSSKRVIYRPELVVKLKQNKGNSADLSDE